MSSPTFTILIADDNPTNLKVLFDYLALDGHRILVADGGESAIKQARYGQPDLILLDIVMPGLDGFETCRRLKADEATRDIPVIFMTANSEASHMVEGFGAGAVDYITKPLRQEEVSVRVRNHISIRRLQTELRAANAGKDVFFSILAHDLKNPIQNLSGLADLLVETMPPEADAEHRQMAADIHSSAIEVNGLLIDLLSWAQLQLGGFEPTPVRIPLPQAVGAVVTLLKVAARQKQIRIVDETAALEGNAEMEGWGDAAMIATVLRNLLGNAVKFTPPGGTVRIGAAREGDKIVVQVSDTGAGIDPARIPGLFRLGATKPTFGTKGEKGTGLGLPLCREMLERNGGAIHAESDHATGSRFTFTLPAAPAL